MLPKRARQIFLSLDGSETENISTFSNCREYRGESTIKFEAPSETGANQAPLQMRVRWWPIFRSLCSLLDPIDTAVAAAGDSFRAILRGTLRDTRKRAVGKTGSFVWGRIRRVQINQSPRAVYLVLSPTEIQTGEERIELAADAETRRGGKGTQVIVPRHGEGHGGVFEFPGTNVVVPVGFESDWRTVAVTENEQDSFREGVRSRCVPPKPGRSHLRLRYFAVTEHPDSCVKPHNPCRLVVSP